MITDDLRALELRTLLAKSTPGPRRVCLVDNKLFVRDVFDIAQVLGDYPEHRERMDADAALIAQVRDLAVEVIRLREAQAAQVAQLDAAKQLAAEVIRLRTEREALRLAGKHLAVKLAEAYRAAGANPTDCQAMRDWLALMPRTTDTGRPE